MTDRQRPAVMTDVAKLAGVSHQTVSRVLNGSPQVRPETRERVLAAVAELGYRPNAMARGLVSRRSKVLGVVTFDTILYGPACMLLGIERAARAAGYGVGIVTLERVDRDGVLAAVHTLTDQGVDGVIVIAPQEAAATALHSLPTPLPAVVVEAGPEVGLPSVSVDQLEGSRLAVRHLLDLGHETVWHLAGPDGFWEARDRRAGWRRTLAAAGAPEPPVAVGDWSARSGYEAGRVLAENPDVTAVFVANDQMALGLLRAFAERGIRVPEQVSVVGFDDIPEAAYLTPALTTVRQDFDEVGRRSMRLLLRLLESADPNAEPAPVTPTLVVRESSTTPR
ncbi:LacI family DNA-binding transcriptional regulator [Nocardia sp. CDC159]|uniref:LacI family DNA-binding transcriptional regulator n=1 Tax=Nocardia pulmonis TaxID=2951408 RepID=A0A9X2E7T9_9NOCA|nr:MULTISPECIES: LacI family DNA-binding transcriptional regulator [Nocardia]MCM6773281.1 LacI family DNA-binding transcriptional regulator [Nocardia pulmonis]MCM6786168.1 LacI family DNA-binding transcriptional regulator [Nocardia sp. CDC159]